MIYSLSQNKELTLESVLLYYIRTDHRFIHCVSTSVNPGCGSIISLTDHFEAGEDAIPGISDVAESVLLELISEQAQWPEDEMADMKMLVAAFEVLEQKGVISKVL